MRARVRWAAILGSVMIMLTSAVSTAAPAQAATSCFGDTCSHLDPKTNGCGVDATTLISFNPQGAYDVQLRYSAACGAAWARLTNTATGELNKYLKLQVWNAQTGGTLLWTETVFVGTIGGGLDWWTAMASFRFWVQACVKDSNDFGWCSARR